MPSLWLCTQETSISVCPCLFLSVPVCSCLFPSVPVCLRLSPAVPVCYRLSRLPPSVSVCLHLSPSFPVFSRLSPSVLVCSRLSPSASVYPSLSPSVLVCLRPSPSVSVCSRLLSFMSVNLRPSGMPRLSHHTPICVRPDPGQPGQQVRSLVGMPQLGGPKLLPGSLMDRSMSDQHRLKRRRRCPFSRPRRRHIGLLILADTLVS